MCAPAEQCRQNKFAFYAFSKVTAGVMCAIAAPCGQHTFCIDACSILADGLACPEAGSCGQYMICMHAFSVLKAGVVCAAAVHTQGGCGRGECSTAGGSACTGHSLCCTGLWIQPRPSCHLLPSRSSVPMHLLTHMCSAAMSRALLRHAAMTRVLLRHALSCIRHHRGRC